ncbi:MAG: hypothetical protein Q9M36_00475 [Sulfurovum sp.]|nr:hypothetical protein [Sulfurovum sp.]
MTIQIEIYFIYRNYEACKELTQIREKNEARKVPNEIFNKKASGSLETFEQLIIHYTDNPNVSLSIIDLDKNEIINTKVLLIERIESYSKALEEYLR